MEPPLDIDHDASPAPPRWFLPLVGVAFTALAFAGVSKVLLQGPCERLVYETCAKAGIPCGVVDRLVERAPPAPEVCESASRTLEALPKGEASQALAFTAFSEAMGIRDVLPDLERAEALSEPPISPEDEAALIALGPMACGNLISRWHADPGQEAVSLRALVAIRGTDPSEDFAGWQAWCAGAFEDAWLASSP